MSQSARWVKIIFQPSMDIKMFVNVTRLYVKASCLCVELPERDEAGRPIIMSYPLQHVFSFSRPHMPHDGAEER